MIKKQTVELNNIQNENILDYLLSFTENNSVFFGFEFMAGGSVADIIKRRFPNGIKDVSAVATILRSVLNGISYLHSNKIFHR